MRDTLMLLRAVSWVPISIVLVVVVFVPINHAPYSLQAAYSWEGREALFWRWMYDRFNLSKPKDMESDAWRNLTGTDYEKYELLTIVYRIIEEEFKIAEMTSLKGDFPPASIRPQLGRFILHEPAVGRGSMRVIDASLRCTTKHRTDELHFKLIVELSENEVVRVVHSSVAVREYLNRLDRIGDLEGNSGSGDEESR
jgi:hypothetical protein